MYRVTVFADNGKVDLIVAAADAVREIDKYCQVKNATADSGELRPGAGFSQAVTASLQVPKARVRSNR